MHLLENEFLRVKVRETGAELTSVFSKKEHIEHLWQAEPDIWGWHAPVLFPVVGRCINDEIIIDGVAYKMEKHGFARKSVFTLLDAATNQIVFSLKSSEHTLKVYPCRFELLVAYKLKSKELTCSFEVINTDNRPLYFQLGGHPAFAVPFFTNENYEDYYLKFETSETAPRHFINSEGYFNGRTETVFNNSFTLGLTSDMFNEDAFVFKNHCSRQVAICSKNHPHRLNVRFAGFNYLGLWAKPNATYVCIEPWLGCADTEGPAKEFSQREGMVKLLPDEEFNASFSIALQ